MPASRSRTEHWRDCLTKVFQRGGSLEISLDRGQPISLPIEDGSMHEQTRRGVDLVWRVKMLALKETSIVVEPPAACGATITLGPNVDLIAAITVGQNRWMFRTKTLGISDVSGGIARSLTLQMPEQVERCTRRGFYRVSMAELQLPNVQCWPLMDPTTVGAAEAANRGQINELLQNKAVLRREMDSTESILLPEVGPMFTARLLNVSGGGLGLLVAPEDARAMEARPFVWMRIDLRPEIPAPIAVTCRLAHTHIDSTQSLYAGMAFDFSQNPSHRKFVIDLLNSCINKIQGQQGPSKAIAA